MRSMKRWYRILAVLLVMLMVACVLPMNAKAQEEVATETFETNIVPNSDEGEIEVEIEDNDTLFEGYIQKQTFWNGVSMFSANYAESVLDEINYSIYQELKAQIENFAKTGGSTKVVIPKAAYENADISVQVTDKGQIGTAMQEKFKSIIDIDLILECLLVDCPYELYWFDKTEGYSVGYSMPYYSSGGVYYAELSNLYFVFAVAVDYQDESHTDQNPCITSKVSEVSKLIEEAQRVVDEHKNKTDREKLYAYKEYICSQVEYNHTAADTPNYPYGAPWQLIYVFDGDTETNVVCEGYSKAFQYLCELSEFYDDDFACYLVTGPMFSYNYVTGEWPGGGHMWNIVALGGVNYLVDVTNSEPGTIGQNGELFMALNPTDGTADVYTIWLNAYNAVQYQYDTDQKELYSEDIRALGSEKTYCLKMDEKISVDTGKYMKAGTKVTPSVVCERGYRLKEYLLNDIPLILDEGTFAMPDKDSVLTAVFEELKLGDMDGDGNITDEDIKTLRRYFIGEFTFNDSYVAEFFDTEEINSVTLIRLKKYLDDQIDYLKKEI